MSITSPQGSFSAGDLAEAGELAALGMTLADIKRQVAAVESQLLAKRPASPTMPELERILAMTAELFPGQSSVRRDFDSDYPEDAWYVVEVEAAGAFDKIMDREMDWHRRVDELTSPGGRFSLCVFPQN